MDSEPGKGTTMHFTLPADTKKGTIHEAYPNSKKLFIRIQPLRFIGSIVRMPGIP